MSVAEPSVGFVDDLEERELCSSCDASLMMPVSISLIKAIIGDFTSRNRIACRDFKQRKCRLDHHLVIFNSER